MQRRLFLSAVVLIAAAAPALAQSDRCRVMDPTGTPLNIRETPGGRVIGTVRNGTIVTRDEQVSDSQGRGWVYVRDRSTGASIGWVFREFVACF